MFLLYIPIIQIISMKYLKQYFVRIKAKYIQQLHPYKFTLFLILSVSLGAVFFLSTSFVSLSRTSNNSLPLMTPVDEPLVISAYGVRMHPIFKKMRMHNGVDFEARLNTPIFATGDGTVKHAGFKDNGFGYYVEIDHGNGFVTRYAHLHRYGIRVKKKQKISAGDLVGLSGNTGRSIGPHLHYEILKKGKRVDPFEYLPLGVKVRERATSQD